METEREFEFAFSSGRAGSGPATWGQHAIWDVVRSLGDDAARYNVSGGAPLSTPLPVARVGDLVAQLTRAHDSLRTRLHGTGDGMLEQVVHADGAVPVIARQSPRDEVLKHAFALHDDLQATPFDVAGGSPVRVGLVESDGVVHYAIFSLSHTATDGWGLRNLLRDFTILATGGSTSDRPPVLQPLEEAALQCSERGRRRDASSRRAWRDKLATAPERQFPVRPGEPPARTFPNAVLNSPALALAMDHLAVRLEVNQGAVLLAAVAAATGRLTGVTDAVFQVCVNNRFVPGLADAVNTIAQEGLFHLARTDEEFAALARRTFGASLSAQRHAYYDKAALDRDIAALPGDRSCVINDLRGMVPVLASQKPSRVPLARARDHTTLSWPVEFPPRRHLTFALDVQDALGSVELAMTADSALIPRTDMERLLLDIEALAVTEALALGAD